MLTFALGSGGGTITLVLAGAAVSALAAAGISLALNLAPNPYAAYEIMTWLMGSLSDRSWTDVVLVTPFILPERLLLLQRARAECAGARRSAGAKPRHQPAHTVRTRDFRYGLERRGIHGGDRRDRLHRLVAPHLVRPLVGHQPSRVLVPAALTGACCCSLPTWPRA
jgi:iron complex transport system permease protein